MIMRSGVILVMVTVECFFKAIGMLGREDVVVPFRQMK
jgi:hypothetical protein